MRIADSPKQHLGRPCRAGLREDDFARRAHNALGSTVDGTCSTQVFSHMFKIVCFVLQQEFRGLIKCIQH